MGGGGDYKRKYGGEAIEVPWLMESRSRLLLVVRAAAKKGFRSLQRIRGMMRSSRGGGGPAETAG